MNIFKRFINNRNSNQFNNLTGLGFGQTNPEWLSLSNKEHFLTTYQSIPDIYNIISYSADQLAKVIWKIKLKNGDIIDQDPLLSLLNKPNILQGKTEWIRDYSHNYDVFGNAYIKSVAPIGFENKIERVEALYILPSRNTYPVGTGKLYNETSIDGILKKYIFQINGIEIPIDKDCIIHKSNINLDISKSNYLEGMSKMIPLQKPISNLAAAYEANNVLINKRGAIGAISSDRKDGDGSIPMDSEERKRIQNDYAKYGLSKNKWQVLISETPIKWHSFAFDSKQLQLFENMSEAQMKIADAYDFPILILASLQGGTFSNLREAKKQLFENNIIPKAQDLADEINRFFNMDKEGKKLIPTFDHIEALQYDKLTQARSSETKAKGIKALIESIRSGLGKEGAKLILTNDFGYSDTQAETIVNEIINSTNNLE